MTVLIERDLKIMLKKKLLYMRDSTQHESVKKVSKCECDYQNNNNSQIDENKRKRKELPFNSKLRIICFLVCDHSPYE